MCMDSGTVRLALLVQAVGHRPLILGLVEGV